MLRSVSALTRAERTLVRPGVAVPRADPFPALAKPTPRECREPVPPTAMVTPRVLCQDEERGTQSLSSVFVEEDSIPHLAISCFYVK
jgi:hypothetical protein